MPLTPLVWNNRDVRPHKAVVSPEFGTRSVLSNEPWTFVRLWLTRQNAPQSDALFYWEQAQQFHKAAGGLPLESAPLLLYYCFLNATKALLSAKGVAFTPGHGVREWTNPAGVLVFEDVGIRINMNGVLPSLCQYYAETENQKTV